MFFRFFLLFFSDTSLKDIPEETMQKIIEIVVFLSSRIDESGNYNSTENRLVTLNYCFTAEALQKRIESCDHSDPLSNLSLLPDLESPDRQSLKTIGTDGAVTSLFRFFQQLEEPLFTLNLYSDFILSGGATPDPLYQECILRSLVNLLPPNTFRVCERLFSFFFQLMFREKMSSAVLGKYFGPIFISTYGGHEISD